MTNEEINAKWAELQTAMKKLRANREKVPLEQLTTRYASGYNALVQQIWSLGVWWADCCVQATPWPMQAGSPEEKEFIAEAQAVLQREKDKPGGLFDQMRTALIDDINMDGFTELTNKVYRMVYYDAFQPFWDRHCRWVGPLNNRWIRNGITGAFWNPRLKSWYDKDGRKMEYTCCWPPSDDLPDPAKRMEESM